MNATQLTPAEMSAEARAIRARELFTYYDTVKISAAAGTVEGWFTSWAALAGARELAFLNRRSIAMVDAAYCNLDTPGQLDVGYLLKEIGVEFYTPVLNDWLEIDQSVTQLVGPHSLFMDMLEHACLKLYLNQDQKLSIPCSLLPAGYGASGDLNWVQNGNLVQSNAGVVAGAMTNGVPDLSNRWRFAKAIEIPRNHVVRATIEFSDFARDNFSRWQGPGYIRPRSGAVSTGWVAADFGIRVTLSGTRIVQLRNAQSF